MRLLLLFDDDTLVGQVAALQCPGGYSINYLTTTPDQRGRGYMKAIYGALGRELEGALFGQIADGAATLPFRQRFPSTRVLARTNTYRRSDDPYFGR